MIGWLLRRRTAMMERKRKGLRKEGSELEGREKSIRLKLAAHTLIVFFLHHHADRGGENASQKSTTGNQDISEKKASIKGKVPTTSFFLGGLIASHFSREAFEGRTTSKSRTSTATFSPARRLKSLKNKLLLGCMHASCWEGAKDERAGCEVYSILHRRGGSTPAFTSFAPPPADRPDRDLAH
ncbi:hypothetical protein Naga_100406g8 [Nannochloropsis gaditana]|uniref:Uncharacterized protein n=1 Tax=Nannochloropsis gaditana TaxID=72520 RepID=W7TH94_9STRA|nr:hypothetical protein Naga_100406g8 [Nannochloropsis gaditana]